jgi:DNA-binding Lrp family transcriptional regulator
MNLNLKQKRILELLSINCRFSNKDIGKLVGLSEDAVNYQIVQLIKKENLAKFSIQFDYRFLGYKHYHVFVRLQNLDFDISKLVMIKSITSINSSYGKFDLQLIVIARNNQELSTALKKIEEVLAVQDMTVLEFDSFYKKFTNIIPPLDLGTQIPSKRKKVAYELNEKLYADAKEISRLELDDVDKKIIRELIKDPRVKFKDISRKTNINHETIRYRIGSYIKKKFIKNFGLLHDFKKYDLYTNYLLLKLRNADEENFKSYLAGNANIFYSAKLIGEYNCIVYMISTNPDEFGKQLKEMRNSLKSSIIQMDLLFLEEMYKYVQFPEELL